MNKFVIKLSNGVVYEVDYQDVIVKSMSAGSRKSDELIGWSSYSGANIGSLEFTIPCVDGVGVITSDFVITNGGDSYKFHGNPANGSATDGATVQSIDCDLSALINESAWRNTPPMSMVTFLSESGVRGISASAVVEPPLDRTDEVIEAIKGIEIPTIDTTQINSIVEGLKFLNSKVDKLDRKVDDGFVGLKSYTDQLLHLDAKRKEFFSLVEKEMAYLTNNIQVYVYNADGSTLLGKGGSYSNSFVISYDVNAARDSWTHLSTIMRSVYNTNFRCMIVGRDGNPQVNSVYGCTLFTQDYKAYVIKDNGIGYALGQGVPFEEVCRAKRWDGPDDPACWDKEIHIPNWDRYSGKFRLDQMITIDPSVRALITEKNMDYIENECMRGDWLNKLITTNPNLTSLQLLTKFKESFAYPTFPELHMKNDGLPSSTKVRLYKSF